jgi:hypothetical protein
MAPGGLVGVGCLSLAGSSLEAGQDLQREVAKRMLPDYVE